MPRIGTPPAHTHSGAGGGGQLDWDDVWSDAAHSHESAGEGGQVSHDAALSGISTSDHHVRYADAEAVAAIEALTVLTPDAALEIAPTSGNLKLNPAGDVDFNNKVVRGGGMYRGFTNADLWLVANALNTEAVARRVVLLTINPDTDGYVEVAYAIPSATPATPYFAQRAAVTTPINPTLPANFLTFRWNSADDTVTVYVNDGGTIRSAVIGTVT